MTLVSDGVSFMWIFAEIPGEGRQTTAWLSTTAIFSIFAGYISSETLEIGPALLYSDTQSIVIFLVIPKCMTLNGYFALVCFRAGSAVSDHATFEK